MPELLLTTICRKSAFTDGFVETPRARRPHKSTAPMSNDRQFSSSESPSASPMTDNQSVPKLHSGKDKKLNGALKIIDGWEEGKDSKVDYSGQFEFGGSLGVSVMMIGFPILMWYMWIGATYYDGKFPLPAEGEGMGDFLKRMCTLVYEGAYPSPKAWAIYWTFF